MGLISKAKSYVTGGGSESDDLGKEFEDEINEASDIEVDPDPQPEPEPEPAEEEWDTCWQFCGDMLEPEGFASMMDFTRKAMFYEIQSSPMYRNRLENGMKTIQNVKEAKKALDEISGADGSMDPESQAERIRGINKLNEELDRLEGKEEQMIDDAMQLGYEALDAFKTKRVTQTGDVDASMVDNDGTME